MINKEILDSLLHYDLSSGEFFWLESRGRVKSGDRAGQVTPYGYVAIKLLGKSYFAHRLAWLTCYGEFPLNNIDHINRNGLDNRIGNLRDVSQKENLFNKGEMSNNTSGKVGIRFRPEYNKWYSAIGLDGRQIHLGSFDTEDEAERAYLAAKAKHHKIGT